MDQDYLKRIWDGCRSGLKAPAKPSRRPASAEFHLLLLVYVVILDKKIFMKKAFRSKIAFFIFFNRNTAFQIAHSLVSVMYVALHFYTKAQRKHRCTLTVSKTS